MGERKSDLMDGSPVADLSEAPIVVDVGDENCDGDGLRDDDSALDLPELLVVGNVGGGDRGDVSASGEDTAKDAEGDRSESIGSPAKVMRIGTMLKRLLKQARAIDLDEASRQRLRDIYESSVSEIGSALSSDLQEELNSLTSSFEQRESPPSSAELQIAKAQLVGWLEGLIRGMQAMLFTQEIAARRQLEALRTELLPGNDPNADSTRDSDDNRPGAYL